MLRGRRIANHRLIELRLPLRCVRCTIVDAVAVATVAIEKCTNIRFYIVAELLIFRTRKSIAQWVIQLSPSSRTSAGPNVMTSSSCEPRAKTQTQTHTNTHKDSGKCTNWLENFGGVAGVRRCGGVAELLGANKIRLSTKSNVSRCQCCRRECDSNSERNVANRKVIS